MEAAERGEGWAVPKQGLACGMRAGSGMRALGRAACGHGCRGCRFCRPVDLAPPSIAYACHMYALPSPCRRPLLPLGHARALPAGGLAALACGDQHQQLLPACLWRLASAPPAPAYTHIFLLTIPSHALAQPFQRLPSLSVVSSLASCLRWVLTPSPGTACAAWYPTSSRVARPAGGTSERHVTPPPLSCRHRTERCTAGRTSRSCLCVSSTSVLACMPGTKLQRVFTSLKCPPAVSLFFGCLAFLACVCAAYGPTSLRSHTTLHSHVKAAALISRTHLHAGHPQVVGPALPQPIPS